MATKKKAEVIEEESSKKRSRLASFLSNEVVTKIIKKEGSSLTLIRASEFKVQKIPRIRTGILDLDYALGGGFPIGRISTLYGQKSSGKTMLMTKTLISAQKMCFNCYKTLTIEELENSTCSCGDYRDPVIVYFDVEGAFDVEWASKLGLDLKGVLLSIPEYAEQVLNTIEAYIRTGEADVIVLDSLAFLSSMKEIERSVSEDTMGLQARKIGTGIRKITAAMNYLGQETGRRPTLLFTNQTREKIGGFSPHPGIVPETQPGGKAPGFAASIECNVKAAKYEIDSFDGRPSHATFKFKVDKNKTYSAKMAGEYVLSLKRNEFHTYGEPMDEGSYVKWGERWGIITRDSGYTCLGRKFRVKADMELALIEDKDFKNDLGEKILDIGLNL